MRKLGRILCLATLIVTLTASICFGAESLQIVDAYPEDGQKNTTIENTKTCLPRNLLMKYLKPRQR